MTIRPVLSRVQQEFSFTDRANGTKKNNFTNGGGGGIAEQNVRISEAKLILRGVVYSLHEANNIQRDLAERGEFNLQLKSY